MKLTLRREGEDRGWPHYLFWGRMRTSTVMLVVAFFATWWLYATYQPPAVSSVEQPSQVVPPGYVPDPEYTWVPRTNVQETTRRPPTTTTSQSTPTTTSEDAPTPSTTPADGVPTTVVDPDGPGGIPPSTVTTSPTPTTGTTPSTLPTTAPTTTPTTVPGPLAPPR